MSPKDVRSVLLPQADSGILFNRYLKTAGKNMAASTTAFVMDNIVDEQGDVFKKRVREVSRTGAGVRYEAAFGDRSGR